MILLYGTCTVGFSRFLQTGIRQHVVRSFDEEHNGYSQKAELLVLALV
jgi:hypothetical protein